jgi:Holliday junction DNA helicase RuvA
MIGYLRGIVLDHQDGKVVLTVGDAQGAIGYAVNVPLAASYLGLIPGNPTELFVHTHVREDALDLYGFATKLEKDLFLTLLTVNGIGPKGALGILSKIEPQTLISAILSGDKESLTQIPGIGKKTAERVVMELADPLRKKAESGAFGARTTAPKKAAQKDGVDTSEMALIRDAKSALMSLGYREQEIGALLNQVLNEAETPPKKAEDLIRSALRALA